MEPKQDIVKDDQIFTVSPDKIIVKDELPRIRKKMDKIHDMLSSILKFGQIQPVVVNKNMELIAGGRRLAACILGNIPVKVCYSDAVDPLRMRELELEENIQRESLTPAEEVLAVAELHSLKQTIYGEARQGATKDQGWGIEQTANAIGKSPASVHGDLTLAQAIANFPSLATCKTKADIKKAVKGLEATQERMSALVSFEETVKESKQFFIENKKAEDHMKEMKEGSVDLLLVDPPYGIDIHNVAMTIGGETGGEHTTTGTKYNDSAEYALSVIRSIATESFRFTRDTAHTYFFCAPTQFTAVSNLFREAGWIVRGRPIIWIKGNSGQNNQPDKWPSSAYEFIGFARKANSRLVLQGRVDWIQCNIVDSGERLHQAEKPVALLKELISRTCLPGAVIYDPCMGSGPTIEAACEMKMIGYGCEKDLEIYASAAKRMSDWIKRQGGK